MQINLDITNIVDYLRTSIVGDNTNLYDPEFDPSDESLENILKIGVYKFDPTATLEELDSDLYYPLILYAKRELYLALATKASPLYDIKTPELELHKETRFDHYYKLISLINGEIDDINSSGGSYKVKAYEVLITNRYFTNRNYELSSAPRVNITELVPKVSKNCIEISWRYSNVKLFSRYCIYIMPTTENGEEYLLDKYNDNALNPKAQLVKEVRDIHNTSYRFSDLVEGQTYIVAVAIYERNGLVGYDSMEVTLKEEDSEEEDTEIPIVAPTDPSTSTDTENSSEEEKEEGGSDVNI